MPLWFFPVVAALSAKGGERVVENPQKILRNKHAIKKYFQITLVTLPR